MTNTPIIKLITQLDGAGYKVVRIRVHGDTMKQLVESWQDRGDNLLGAMFDPADHSLFRIPFICDATLDDGEVRVELAGTARPTPPRT